MARRRSFIAQVQREIARQRRAATRTQAAYHRQQQAMHREAERAAKAAQRATVAEERERKRLYLEARVAAVAADNADLQAHLDELDGLLATTLSVDDHVELQRLKKVSHHPPFEPGPLATPFPAPHWSQYVPTAPTGLAKLFGGASKYEQQLAVARQSFAQAQAQHAAAEEDRRQRLAATEAAYQLQCQEREAEVAAHNAEVDKFAEAFAAADPAAVVDYFSLVLGNSVYPDDFPHKYRLAYVPESRQLVVEYELPGLEVVPPVRNAM